METLKKLRKIRWFTLVELIVVVTVLAILATIGFLSLSGYSDDAKDAAIKANVRSVYTAINAESTITGNSPRRYISHDAGAALSWAFIAIDGNPVVLSGGKWDVPGTNYSAGKPDFAQLKLNPAKFKISSRIPFLEKTVDETLAADYQEMIAGAADIVRSGKQRAVWYLQVAGISPVTKIASVAGNLPADQSGSVMGLIKDPSDSASATGFVIDGRAIGSITAPQSRKSCLEIKNSGGWNSDGVYSIDPDGSGGNAPFQVYCDMTTDGGGWTLTFYAPSMPTDGSADLYCSQVVIKGLPLKTYTSDATSYPVLANGTVNAYGELLFKWGNSNWAWQKGNWNRMAMFPEWTTNMSTTFDGVLNSDGSTTLYHFRKWWAATSVDAATYYFWIWDDPGLSNICWGANTAYGKNCPYFQYTTYPYHYETASPRWLFVR